MIKIEFTCYSCKESWEIIANDIDEKSVVPVCDDCYKSFLAQKGKLIRSFTKRLVSIYGDYAIPADTFNAGEDIVIEDQPIVKYRKEQENEQGNN